MKMCLVKVIPISSLGLAEGFETISESHESIVWKYPFEKAIPSLLNANVAYLSFLYFLDFVSYED